MKKKIGGWKKAVVAGALTASLGLGFWASKSFYTVREVLDGDTFVVSTGQHIRLDSIDAPEIDSCLGEESKTELEKLVLNKKVYLRVNFIDEHKRLIASAFTANGNIGEKMLEKGLATYAASGANKGDVLLNASNEARDEKLGVYSSVCTQFINPENEKCNIKGNVRKSQRLYRYPGCEQYNNTIIQLHFGDNWFCSQLEARNAGFIKGPDCN